MENEFRKNTQGFAANGPNPSLAPAFPSYPVVDNQQNNGSHQGGKEAHRLQAIGTSRSLAKQAPEAKGNKRTSDTDPRRYQTAPGLLPGNDELCDCPNNQPG